MKRLRNGLITATFIFLAAATPVFAQQFQPIELCPTGVFQPLCELARREDIFSRIVGLIISILLILAVVISVIFLIWGGIRWILSGGDKTAVESARNTIIAAIIGLVVALVAFFIINIVARLILGPQADIFRLQLPSL